MQSLWNNKELSTIFKDIYKDHLAKIERVGCGGDEIKEVLGGHGEGLGFYSK